MHDYLSALLGGFLIGCAASFLLISQGRVFGISGILGGLTQLKKNDVAWRLAILLGFLASGVFVQAFSIHSFAVHKSPPLRMIAAGLLVGFGTQLGGGCTSGHGVCGISRLSLRSLTATLIFIVSGAIVVYLNSYLGL